MYSFSLKLNFCQGRKFIVDFQEQLEKFILNLEYVYSID